MTTKPPRETQIPLPGLDSAPDVYATPDFDEDVTEESTTSSPERGSESDTSHDDDDDDDDDDEEEDYGISRRRLYPERARSRFGAQQQRQYNKPDGINATRRHLRQGHDDEEEEEETLEAKIARLRREVEECKLEVQAEQLTQGEGEKEESGGGTLDAIETLSRIMSGLDTLPTSTATSKRRRGHARTRSAYHDAPTIPPSTSETSLQQQRPLLPEEEEKSHETTGNLTSITSFDARLAAIETSLGLSSLSAATEESALTCPLLPTIALLDHRIATLTSATSLSALEAASSRIQKLKREAAELTHLQSHPPHSSPRTTTTTTTTTATTTSSTSPDNDDEEEEEEEDEEKDTPPSHLSQTSLHSLHSLYTLLPQILSLTPLIPTLLNRLRSLRTLHTAAAASHRDLDALEQRQEEMEKELGTWRVGLERVEEVVGKAEVANGKNGEFVRGWVEELEGRVRALGGGGGRR